MNYNKETKIIINEINEFLKMIDNIEYLEKADLANKQLVQVTAISGIQLSFWTLNSLLNEWMKAGSKVED